MTRKEEIDEAAKEFALSDNTETTDLFDAINDFYYGAKWADEHPKEGLVSIDKACEYLESAIKPYIGYNATCDFVDTFRKIMENNNGK